MGLVYESNPKHSEPWSRGRRGAQCPREASGPELLADSVVDASKPRARWATDGVRAYEGKPSNIRNAEGNDVWHGHPVPWDAVPPQVRQRWMTVGKISRRTTRRVGP